MSTLGDSPSFRAYGDGFKAGLQELSRAFYACQLAFRDVADSTRWLPASDSPAAEDVERISRRRPPYPAEAPKLISVVVYSFLWAAG